MTTNSRRALKRTSFVFRLQVNKLHKESVLGKFLRLFDWLNISKVLARQQICIESSRLALHCTPDFSSKAAPINSFALFLFAFLRTLERKPETSRAVKAKQAGERLKTRRYSSVGLNFDVSFLVVPISAPCFSLSSEPLKPYNFFSVVIYCIQAL